MPHCTWFEISCTGGGWLWFGTALLVYSPGGGGWDRSGRKEDGRSAFQVTTGWKVEGGATCHHWNLTSQWAGGGGILVISFQGVVSFCLWAIFFCLPPPQALRAHHATACLLPPFYLPHHHWVEFLGGTVSGNLLTMSAIQACLGGGAGQGEAFHAKWNACTHFACQIFYHHATSLPTIQAW